MPKGRGPAKSDRPEGPWFRAPTSPDRYLPKEDPMAVSKRLRYEILRRDNFTCRYCGASAPDVPLRVDHVTPVALGGSDDPSNLVASCEPCNSGKTSTTPDSVLVADVSSDALRWVAAIKQAAAEMEEQEGPKLQYRQAFLDAWNEWTWERKGKRQPFELPDDWRSGVERYRVAGIPVTAWHDLIEPGMTNRNVKSPDIFRYTCGVANNRLKELADRARQILGANARPTEADSTMASVTRSAAFEIWQSGMADTGEPLSADRAEAFRKSLSELSDTDLMEPGRIIDAAEHATYFDISDITEALKGLDRSRIWSAWISAWPRTYVPGDPDEPWSGSYVGGPSDEAMDRMKAQIGKFLDADVSVFRVVQAAAYAGFHKSERFYRGLTADELAATGEVEYIAKALEIWSCAYEAATSEPPSRDEFPALLRSLQRVGQDGEFFIADVYAAAAAAGAYRDPDLSTCLPRHLSVFEAAALPLQGAAA